MQFLLDENVANSVCEMFREAGHDAIFVRELLPTGAIDPLVAALADAQRSILVSHDRDFRQIAPRIPDGQKRRFRNLSQLRLMCPEPRAATRIRSCLPFIELEYRQAEDRDNNRMLIEVKKTAFTVYFD